MIWPQRRTKSLRRIATAILESEGERLYGYPLTKAAGVRSGVLYPILHHMLEEGWLVDGWEDEPGRPPHRPRRRYYQLTETGHDYLRSLQ